MTFKILEANPSLTNINILVVEIILRRISVTKVEDYSIFRITSIRFANNFCIFNCFRFHSFIHSRTIGPIFRVIAGLIIFAQDGLHLV